MNLPLERKRRPGRPKTTTKALTRQPNETQLVDDLGISSCEESEHEAGVIDEQVQKKIRLEESALPVKKKRGWPVGIKNKKK